MTKTLPARVRARVLRVVRPHLARRLRRRPERHYASSASEAVRCQGEPAATYFDDEVLELLPNGRLYRHR